MKMKRSHRTTPPTPKLSWHKSKASRPRSMKASNWIFRRATSGTRPRRRKTMMVITMRMHAPSCKVKGSINTTPKATTFLK